LLEVLPEPGFATEFGISIRRYFIRLRLQAAAQRISEGAGDLTTLALDLGLLQRTHEDRLEGKKYELQEIRRRIAEALLNEAILHGCPYSTCRAGFRRLRSGFQQHGIERPLLFCVRTGST
jgi:hypothetical protein